MLTDKQLWALMQWVSIGSCVGENWTEREEKRRLELYEAFGFIKGEDGKPVAPQASQSLPTRTAGPKAWAADQQYRGGHGAGAKGTG